MVASDGGIFNFGASQYQGSMGGKPLNKPVVGIAPTPTGQGYWMVATDGGIFSFGDAQYLGSMGGKPLNKPVVGMASTPDGGGYWLVASDGGIFAFGDAAYLGSMGAKPLNKPVVGMASTPDGGGYWLVASDGGIFAFGDAGYMGSMGAKPLNQPMVGMASTPSGLGYWLVASDGGIFTFGDAGYLGSMGGTRLNQPVVGMAAFPALAPAHISVSPSTPTALSADQGASGLAVSVHVTDRYGHAWPGASVSFARSGLGSGSLSSGSAVADGSGNASTTFFDTHAGDAGTVTATVSGTSVSSATGTISVIGGRATSMAFSTQPGNGTGGTAFPTQPVVTLHDAFGNVATDSSAVTLSITGGTGTAGATLACTANPSNASAGVAGFAGCNIDKAGTGYTLRASDGALPAATSSAFNVTVGPAAKLAFTQQPGNGTGGTALPTQPKVSVEDAGGNVVTGDTSFVSLAISSGTGTAGASLACTSNPLAASSGVASFAGCNIDKAGTGYTLSASDGSLTGATSSAFNITVGPAAMLAFTQQPGNGTGGTALPAQPVVTVEDAGGNTVTTDASAVTLSISSGTGTAGATLACTANPSNASAGVASFAGCKVDKAGTGYTLSAVDGSLTGATSSAFNVAVGPATKLAFTQQPSNGTGGTALPTQPTVSVEDAGGNVVTGDGSSVTLAIRGGTGTAGAVLTCTTNPLGAASGVAAFAGCNIDKAGTGYVLHATDGVLTTADSAPLNITVGPAAKLAFSQQPSSSTGGTAFPSQPAVTVEDAGGNVVTSDSSAVTLSITSATGAPGAALTCTTNPLNASSGVATFSGCAIDKSGTSYRLHASDGSLSLTDSAPFDISVGSAAKLGFVQQPGSSTGGIAFPVQPSVAVQDAGGNTITTDTSSITLSIASGTGTPGATLACTPSNTMAASSGVAAFSGCAIDKSGSGYKLHAADAGLTPVDSAPFNITVGPAVKLAFTQQPSSSTGGTAFPTQPKVAVEDAGGNIVTTDTSGVTLNINSGTGTAGAALACTANPTSASSGVAAFGGCAIDKAGNGYTLHATDASLSPSDSAAFNITVGPAAKLAFTTQPSSSSASQTAFATQPAVTVEDLGGNTVTTDTSPVTLTISTGTGTAGASLSCTANTVNAVSGVATFSGCKVDKTGTGYTLHAADGSLTPSESASFAITPGTASKLVFTTQPASSTGGTAFPTQPVVTVEDSAGNTVTGNTSAVTLAIKSGTPAVGGPGALTCTTNPLNAVAGVAAFTGCKIDHTGTGYVLEATDGALALADSNSFNITVGPAAQLVFTQSPSSSTGGVAFPTQPKVTVEDAGGNVVATDSSTVALAIAATTPTAGGPGTLSGCSGSELAGVVSFSGCKIDTAGTGYELTATDATDSLTTPSAPSAAFDITVGPATQVGFSVQPSNAVSTKWISPPIQVQIQDAGGNLVSTATNGVGLVLTNPNGATLAGTTARVASGGVATFNDISVNLAGTYSLTASSTGLTNAVSTNFTITHDVAAKLSFTTPPSNSTGGTPFGSQPIVTVEDLSGNTVTNDSSAVTLSVTSGTGTPGAQVSCTTNPLAASAGVAHFLNCSVDKAGTGYTLHATDGTLSPADSGTFNITVGPAAKLAFTQQPSSSSQSQTAFATQPKVAVEDAGGNIVTTDTSNVTLSITPGTGTAGAILTCTSNPTAAVSGVAAFAGCNVDLVGTGYTLHAVDASLTPADSTAFAITPGNASKLVFTTSPSSSTGGTAFGTQPVVTVEDAAGNTVTSDASTVTLSITAGTPSPGGPGTLTCAGGLGKVASSGVASFTGCAIDTAGTGYKLHAADGALTPADSSAFNVTVGPATQLAFTQQPSGGTGGTAFATQPKVAIEDAGGNIVSTDTSSVTLAIAASTPTSGGPGVLTCTANPVAAGSGVATFAGCAINNAGTGYKLHASDGALTAVNSTAFNVTIGPASQLAFTTQPSASSASQAAFATQPAVTEEDAGGNPVTTDSTHTVTLSLDAPASGGPGTLGCTQTTVTLASGVATFAGCNVDKVGSGYRLHATTTAGAFTADSSAFSITPGTSSKLVFTTQPGGGTGGTAWAQQPVVTVEDAAGNTVTGDSSAVSLSITVGTPSPGGPGTLTCTTNPLGATAGVASFTGCEINTTGTGYKLHAADGGLTAADSSAFNITVGSAAQLAFTTQPSSSTGGTAFGTQPVVTVQDAGGNTVTSDTSTVTLAIATGTGTTGATLSCTGGDSKAAVSGVATFAGCNIDKTGTGYKLHASDATLVAADSTVFNITLGTPAKVVFTSQPSSSTGGVAFPTQPAVSVEDAGGNVETADASTVTLSITSSTGTVGATLSCTGGLSKVATAGVATFSGCAIDKSGTAYQLHAIDGALPPVDSSAFNIAVGPAAKLVVTQQPATSTGGVVLPTQPTVTVEDAGGNTVSTDASPVTLALINGTAGANLTCTSNPLAATSGVAAFSGCKVDKSGTGYKLHATDGSLTPTDSNAFDVNVGPAAQVAFTQQPSGSTGGVAFPTQPTVSVEDAGGNVVTTDASTVTLAITPGTPSPAGPGALTCTGGDSMAAASGVASFGGCKINTAGTGYKLRASDSGFAATTDSTAFNITVGPAAKVAFTQQPASSTGGTAFPTQPTVSVEDAGGNVVSTDTSTVTLAITASTPASGGPGTLTCTGGNSLAATSGAAAFAGCAIDKAGTGYTLHASDGALAAADSTTFNVTVGAATQVAFTQSPSSSTGGTAFGTQPVVAVEDAGGNTVTTDSSTVTLSITTSTGTSGAALTCTGGLSKAAASGVATFAGCAIDKAGTNYQLHATDAALHAADSATFNITVGAAAKLGFTQSPGATNTGGVAFGTQPVVAVEDAGGNTVTSDGSSVTLSITPTTPTSGGPGTLTCTTNPVTATSGVATFAGCKIDKAGTAYQLHAADGALTAADSTAFNVVAGTASKLVFTQQPSSSTGGTAFGTQPIVKVEDSGGNVVTTDNSTVTLSITPGTPGSGGPGTLTCTGTDSLAATSGVASFAGCAIDKVGTGYQLHAADGTLTATDSTLFNITLGSAAKLGFTQQPSGGTGGTAFGTQPQVTVEDAGGNAVTTDTSPVSLVIKSGTGTSGAALTCTANPVNATNGTGTAAFAGCKIDKSGTGYQLHATDGVLTAADSTAFDITVGSPAQLAFSQQPTDTSVGAAITPAPAVTIEDAGGNVVTTAGNTVNMAIGTNTAGGTLSGTLSQSPTAGVATFPGLSINKPGTNYTLSATSSGLTTATSTAFKEFGTATQLAFVTEPPASTTAGQTMTSFQVAVEDAAGNILTGSTAQVALTSNPVTTVGGTKTQVVSSGVATFNDIVIDQSGSYTFTANSTALTNATSTSFTINPAAAAKVVCTNCPTNNPQSFTPTAGGTTTFTLQLEDQFGNALTSNSSTYNITTTLTAAAAPTPADAGQLKSGATTSAPDATGVPTTVTVTIGPGNVSATVSYIAPAVLPPGGRGTITFSDASGTTITAPADSITVQDP